MKTEGKNMLQVSAANKELLSKQISLLYNMGIITGIKHDFLSYMCSNDRFDDVIQELQLIHDTVEAALSFLGKVD